MTTTRPRQSSLPSEAASSRRRRGRPSEFTQSRVSAILAAVRLGMSFKDAAACAGVSYMTFNRWRERGMAPNAPEEYCDFCRRLDVARAEVQNDCLKQINKAAIEDWKAAAWLLERLNPEDWGKRGRESAVSFVPVPNALTAQTMSQDQTIAAMTAILRRVEGRNHPDDFATVAKS